MLKVHSIASLCIFFTLFVGAQIGAALLTGSATVALIASAFVMITAYPIYRRAHVSSGARAQMKQITPRLLPLLGTLCVVWFAGQLITLTLYQHIPAIRDYYNVVGRPGAENELLLTVVAITLAPIAEEILMRGVLYREPRTRLRFGALPAIMTSAVVFAIFHGDPARFVAALLLGMVLALALQTTKTIAVPIALHALYNLLSSVVPVSFIGFFGTPLIAVFFTATVSLVVIAILYGESQTKS